MFEDFVTVLDLSLESFSPLQHLVLLNRFLDIEGKSQVKMDMSTMASDMPGMTMSGSAASSTASAADALSTANIRMGNESAQMDFLMELLDDTEIQVIANSYARRYWYGVVVVIGLATLLNVVMRVASRSRQVSPNVYKYQF